MGFSKKILIIEDDKNISRLVKYNLEREGFNCICAYDGEEALEVLDRQSPDLIILDIMLPTIDGFEVCRQIKQDRRHSCIPIIVLSAKGEEIDRVVGFELGADDYVTKPFSSRELALRVKAVLKRESTPENTREMLNSGPLIVDIPRHKVTTGKKTIELTAMEFKLLVTLMQRRGRVQSRERLLSDVWDMAADVTTRTIDTHIKRLRQKLGRASKFIETVRGVGYRFREEE
ncbi:MAG: response regulator [Candidatus Omnitrophica bacterium]|nr:response regulator [Candidatus Omnitrophota bacterium]MBD3268704.1 response regulator [Candidatus Omnitrophota bacterium]